ncbi:hypothetical protein L226DRAFT_525975 [Lentinus tigrinus ALCF2SS1-7]|uniref:Uncharacterized protein n=1 Tax=Lentinus tigrinus ALCF2SS1-6 TaxID=1328759 RepID=A0A5C2RVZ9_9APHY|nr:hypothetical protein L227DRAFT_567073 [Lentinus tigrinus ALCF2SS1-6]RPD70500.1 hypothetical protein L226DRAFT_525975 [Lentinus tigrinus ALCF2SS1-7]
MSYRPYPVGKSVVAALTSSAVASQRPLRGTEKHREEMRAKVANWRSNVGVSQAPSVQYNSPAKTHDVEAMWAFVRNQVLHRATRVQARDDELGSMRKELNKLTIGLTKMTTEFECLVELLEDIGILQPSSATASQRPLRGTEKHLEETRAKVANWRSNVGVSQAPFVQYNSPAKTHDVEDVWAFVRDQVLPRATRDQVLDDELGSMRKEFIQVTIGLVEMTREFDSLVELLHDMGILDEA